MSLDALVQADALAKKLPRGYGTLADQLRRASQSAFLQLSQGAARSGADRAQRLRCARAEACEAAACVEGLGRLTLATAEEVALLLQLLGASRPCSSDSQAQAGKPARAAMASPPTAAAHASAAAAAPPPLPLTPPPPPPLTPPLPLHAT